MTITRQDIKILKSDNVSDFEDGGGRVTNREVMDGDSNDLFLDIPATSRAYGDVDMVKIYPAVTTQDSEPFLGSVFSLGRLPKDESVNITLFTTKNWFDVRKEAIKTLEGYLAPSVKIEGELLELQLKGQKVIQLITTLKGEAPAVGKSLYLIQDEGKPTMVEQYVFVTAVSVQERAFRIGGSDMPFKVVTVEISTKLDHNFRGITPSQFNSSAVAPAVVRDTRVADTASYYTTKPLQEVRTIGDASIKVEDIFTQLVPSARQDKPLSGLDPSGTSTAIVPVGIPVTKVLESYQVQSTVSYSIGTAIAPNSISMTLGTTVFEEDNGALKVGGVTVGFIDYQTGILSWLSSFTPATATLSITYTSATLIPTINESLPLEVTEGNRGLSLAWTLGSVPLAGSLIVTYVVLGDIYTLRDQGGGILRGANESFGVGRINYQTGDVLLSFGSEPDVGSMVLFTWANNNGVSDLTKLAPSKLRFTYTLPSPTSGKAVTPSTIKVTWGDKSATISGRSFVGDATGQYNPKTREIVVEPNILPPVGTPFSVTYKEQPTSNLRLEDTTAVTLSQEPSSYHANDAIVLRFKVDVSDPNIIRSSFGFSMEVRLVQNIPFKAQFGKRSVYFSVGKVVGDIGTIYYYPESNMSYNENNLPDASLNPIEVGTINFSTGAVVLVPTAATYTWWEQEYDYTMTVFGAARYTSK